MALKITLVKTPAVVSASKTSHIFNQQGGTLGRADGNTWVLADPEKFLSSRHCEILFDGRSFFIVDLSTNGTFLNGAFEPIGRGMKSPLKSGDFFEAGEYRFTVHLDDLAPFGNEAIFSSQLNSSPDFHNSNIFSPVANTPFTDPFGDGDSDSPFGSADLGVDPQRQNLDPLIAMDKANRTGGVDNFVGAQFEVESLPIANKHHDPFANIGQVDQTPSLDQAIAWPAAKQENLIPDDWEDDFLITPLVPEPIKQTIAAKVSNPVPSKPVFVRTPDVSEEAIFSEPLAVQAPVFTPTPEDKKPSVPIGQAAVSSAPVPVSHSPLVNSVSPSNQGDNISAHVKLLAEAMGLDVKNLTAEQLGDLSVCVGELMREIVDGMMQVLRSRNSIKNEFRMNVTTIQPIENNPLKFSVGVDEALENMFLKKTNAFKKPTDSFREGFQEIGEHQLAMIAGIRFGFDRMMDRFNPDQLEKMFNKQGKGGGVIPGMQKAKFWSGYRDYYSSFSDNMESSFQHLFGSDFVSAYEDQLRKLASARKKNK